MKKVVIIITIILCSILFAFSANAFIVNSEELVPFLFTLLGLCLTAYTFIYTPILQILNRKDTNKERIKDKLKKLIKSFEDDMLCIFFFTITIIFLDFIKKINVPILKDFNNIKIYIIEIKSIKILVTNFIISISACSSFYAVYDLMKATFKILKESFEKNT